MYGLNDIKKYEEEKKAQQPSPMPGVAPASTPAAPVQEVPKDTGLQQQRREELRADMAKPLNAPLSMGDVAFINTPKVLEKWDLDKMAESQRNNYMQSFDTWAEAEKRGDISQQAWANAKIQQMIAEGKNPGEYLNMLALVGSAETPEQKRKRERREALGETFRGLGNLIGNVANLYYTHRGGQYIDLNSVNEKHRERMEKIKEKQDALAEQRQQILLNAKMGDIQAARKAASEKEQRAYDEQIRKENREYQEKKDKQAQDNWNKQFDWTVKQAEQNAKVQEEERAYRRKQDALNNAFRWAQFNWQKEKADGKSSGSGKSKTAVVDTPNGVMDVDFGRINQRTYDQLYYKVPDEIKKKYAFGVTDDDKARQEKMGQAISEALLTQEGYADWLVKAGVGTYQQKQTPKDYSAYLMDDGYGEYMRKTGEAPSVNESTSTAFSVDDVKKALEERSKRKQRILQAGKDSLNKNNGYGMKSDTFR